MLYYNPVAPMDLMMGCSGSFWVRRLGGLRLQLDVAGVHHTDAVDRLDDAVDDAVDGGGDGVELVVSMMLLLFCSLCCWVSSPSTA